MNNPSKLQSEAVLEFDYFHKNHCDFMGGISSNIVNDYKQLMLDQIQKAYEVGKEEIKNKLLIKNPTGGYENSFNNRVKEILKENK